MVGTEWVDEVPEVVAELVEDDGATVVCDVVTVTVRAWPPHPEIATEPTTATAISAFLMASG